MDGTEKSVDPSAGQIPATKLHSSKVSLSTIFIGKINVYIYLYKLNTQNGDNTFYFF